MAGESDQMVDELLSNIANPLTKTGHKLSLIFQVIRFTRLLKSKLTRWFDIQKSCKFSLKYYMLEQNSTTQTKVTVYIKMTRI